MLFVAMTAAAVALVSESVRTRRVMLLVLAVFWVGMTFPPGGLSSIEDDWKWWGGPVWVSLGLFFVTLWHGLGASVERAVGSRPDA